jgi:hypothetical protein
MLRWLVATFGVTPDPSISFTTTALDLNYLDLFKNDGSAPAPVDFESINYNKISSHEAMAFAAGDYTLNGWLQNKKLRILPLGGKGPSTSAVNSLTSSRFDH